MGETRKKRHTKQACWIVITTLVAAAGTSAQTPDATTLLSRCKASLDKFDSFIVESESSAEVRKKFPHESLHDESHRCSEIRYDGTIPHPRIYLRTRYWGYISSLLPDVPRKKALQTSWLARENLFLRVSVNPRGPKHDLAVFNKPQDTRPRPGLLTRTVGTGPLLGFFEGDDRRVDEILATARRLSVRPRMQPADAGGPQCYVLEGWVKPEDRYTLWLAPDHGYLPAKVIIRKGTKGKYYEHDRGEYERLFTSFKNVRFEKKGDAWIPVEADLEFKRSFKKGYYYAHKCHHKITRFELHPDHAALRSFEPNDIREGAEVCHVGRDEEYVWKGGKAVPVEKTKHARHELTPQPVKRCVRERSGR